MGNYSVDDPALRLTVALLSSDGKVLTRESKDLRLPKGRKREITAALAVPLDAGEGEHRVRATLSRADGPALREVTAPVKLVPCVSIRLTAPGEFHGPGERLAVSVRLEKRSAEALKSASLVCSLADRHLRPLLRREVPADFAREAKEFTFEFVLPDLPAGGYRWLAEVRRGGRAVVRKAQPLARMEPWRFRKELIVAPFGFGPLQPTDEIDALRSIGMTTYGLPASLGMWTYVIESPTFLPRYGWPADILDGPEGDEWRKLAQRYRSHPFMTFLDTTEESDLAIGSNLISVGDVEQAGHEQYRTYLKRKYRTLSALNAAWKSDYTDFSEVLLLGGVPTSGGHVLYTSRMGGTSGEMVPVPKQLDPARGVVSRQPYRDQNAWRWYYVWLLLEVRHAAFRQVDPYHPLTPGGAMGLHAPFDYPHFRIYTWEPLTQFSRRVTFGRPTYGDKPHIVLIGVPRDEKAVAKTCWQALASGGRSLMPYGAGDGYGARILDSAYKPTDMGLAFGRAVAKIKAKQEVLLATRNAVDRDVLLLSVGDSGYASAFSLEFYDAVLQSGVLPDYGSDLAGRKLVMTGARDLPAETVGALGKFVEGGGSLVVLSRVSPPLLRRLGLQREAEKLRGSSAAKVTLTEPPAMLKATLGKGAAWLLNFDFRYGKDLDSRYAPTGKVRREAEAHRRAVAAVLEAAGVAPAFRTVDADGSAMPYVHVEPLATADGSQRYLIAYADDRLPKAMASARGQMRVNVPGVRSVYDVYAERALPLRDGRFPFNLPPGEGSVFALLTEAPTTVEVTPEVSEFGPGRPLRAALRVQRSDGKGSQCEHALNVRVFGPAGKEIAPLHRRVSVRGQGVVSVLPAWSDPDGPWRIVAHDLTTGARGEARVHKRNAAAPPPLEPGEAFRPTAPDVHLAVEPLPPLDALANFVRIAATVSSPSKRPAALRVRLRIGDDCLLAGRTEQTVRLTPEAPSRQLAWTAFISRDSAVGFHYSDRPSGFFTDSLYPAIYRYRGAPTPAIELEPAGGERLTFQAGDGPVSPAAPRFGFRVPVRMNPFERAPAPLGTFQPGKLAVTVLNATGSALAGKVLIEPHPQWTALPRELDLAVEPGKTATLTVAPHLRPNAAVAPGVFDVPLRIRLGRRELAVRGLTVEHKLQRRWFVRRGGRVDAERPSPPFNLAGPFPESDGWRPIVTEARMPLTGALPKTGSVAYLATSIHSPDERPVRIRIVPVGARTRAWLNGALIGGGAKALAGQPGPDGENVLPQLGSRLRKGPNPLVLEVLRTRARCRGCAVTFLDKAGKTIRDIRLDPIAGETQPAP